MDNGLLIGSKKLLSGNTSYSERIFVCSHVGTLLPNKEFVFSLDKDCCKTNTKYQIFQLGSWTFFWIERFLEANDRSAKVFCSDLSNDLRQASWDTSKEFHISSDCMLHANIMKEHT